MTSLPTLLAHNLTRDEAGERAGLIEVEDYDVELDTTRGDAVFGSRTRVRFRCSQPGASTFIELTAPALRTAFLNGTALDPAVVFDGERVQLADLAAHNELVLDADAAYSHTGEGLHRFVDPVDGEVYLYSQFETYDAHRMYACFDQPDLKAVFHFAVTAPAHWVCVSNAAVQSRTEVDDERARWLFAPTARLSPYITAVVAGPYAEVRDHHDGIDLGLYCRASLAAHLDAEELFAVTKQGFDFYHGAFDYRYPFGKYDQLFVPEFNAGAMENAGCVTFLEDYVFRSRVTDARYERRAETVLHEMAHMWFGDLVTMRWWDDLWLNESFASFMAVLAQASATRWTGAWTTFCNSEKTWAYQQDQLPSTHPVAADAPDIETVRTNFDGITYAKGASLLKQLVAWVGQEEFLAGLRVYFRRHAYANTSLGDLLAVLEESSGRDLSQWSAQWLQTSGVATLRPAVEVDDDGVITRCMIYQQAPPDHPELRSHRVAVGLYDLTPAGLIRRLRVELDVVGERTEVGQLVGSRRPDLLLVNDDDLTYAKIRLDETSMATAVTHLASLADPLARALVWSAAWDMTRDAELPARDYVSLVIGAVPTERDIGVLTSLLAKAESASISYGDPANLAKLRGELTGLLRRALEAAAPGSDQQLAFTTAYARLETDPAGLAWLQGLLDGTTTVAGLAVDADLRWHLIVSLSARGVVDDAEISAELTRDNTAAGAKRAAAARSARPDAAAKAAAWAGMVDSDALSNHLVAATAGAFWRAEQADLTRGYRDRYFAALGPIWAQRPPEIAQLLTAALYPAVLIEEETLVATDAYLATEGLPAALRRQLVEERDRVRRALVARDCDRAAGLRVT